MIATQTRTVQATNQIQSIVSILKNDGIILMPSDTIWGIACDATNPTAVERIFNVKQKNKKEPLILLADSMHMVKRYVRHVHPRMETLLELHHRPLTVIYDQGINLAPQVASEDQSVAIRIVKDSFCQKLIRRLRRPLAFSPARIGQNPYPTNFGSISSEVIIKMDHVVRHRQQEIHGFEPSVIVRILENGQMDFVRN